MPGEAQNQRAPKPLTVEQAITFLRSQPADHLLCVSAPGGPDRCVTGAITVRGHTRLTTMPGWQPGTGAGWKLELKGDESSIIRGGCIEGKSLTLPTPTKVAKTKHKRKGKKTTK